ncbi:MAG: HAMP domain-containing sensor histidine kinase, partial [Verrucomicrobia bacterium]|nr:HAMP domain-containing sensor histidine kinase [Verrucomicrobiota bacterium]
MIIIAAVALKVIIQNRTEVEREARRRAEELARQFSNELERHLGSSLLQHDIDSDRWCDYLAEVTGGWPGSKRRAQLEAEWHLPPDPPYPGWQAEDVFPDRFVLRADGRFAEGLEFNPAPQPPAWLTALSAEQQAAWVALSSAAASGFDQAEIEQCIVRLEETGPELAAKLNAAFVGLRARLARLPPAEAVTQALRFAREGARVATRPAQTNGEGTSVTWQMPSPRQHWSTLSPAGLPLASLAFQEALRYARVTGPSEQLWNAIPDQVLRMPGPLTPAWLDQLQALAGTNTALQASVEAWRTLWNARLKLSDIAVIVGQSVELHGITVTNLWIDQGPTRWLCILNPNHSYTPQVVNGGVSETATEVRFLPKPVIEHALAQSLENSELKLPDYLSLAASLEGEPLTLPGRWSAGRATNSARALLTQASGQLAYLGKLRKAPDGPLVDVEGLPSHPRFVLQLYVSDPALLLASYRRQALLLAGLVAASVFAALVGVLASWSAFQRQLRLNVLKSNFVSSISHELRAPIASVRLMAESLERGKISEPSKQQEYFRFIVQECRRLSSLIENVLDFSRIEQGRKQYDLEPTDLVALTQQTVKLMETYATERGVNLALQLPATCNLQPATFNHQLPDHQLPNYQLPADGKALQQALVNLIDNALKHSPQGDTVMVGLEVQSPKSKVQSQGTEDPPPAPRSTLHAPRLCLWVEDHGEG